MKSLVLAVLLSVTAVVSGCRAVNAPLPAGAPNAVDATANETLQSAHAFAADITAAIQSTDPNVHITLTPAQITAVNNLNKALNIADALLISYHQSQSPTVATQLNAAVGNVQTSLASAQSLVPAAGGK